MKGYVVIILLLVGTGIATYLFQQKHKNNTDLLDVNIKGLAPIAKMLPLNASIYYDTINVNHDVFTRARYALAPINLTIAKGVEIDTLLSIIDTNSCNSGNYTTLPKVLNKTKNSNYYYILSTSK